MWLTVAMFIQSQWGRKEPLFLYQVVALLHLLAKDAIAEALDDVGEYHLPTDDSSETSNKAH